MTYPNLSDEDLVRVSINNSLSKDLTPELTRRLMETNRELNKSINNLAKETKLYSWVLIGLTIVLVALTVVLVVGGW